MTKTIIYMSVTIDRESKLRRMSKEGRINQLDENEGWYGFHSDAREDEQLRAARHVGEGRKEGPLAVNYSDRCIAARILGGTLLPSGAEDVERFFPMDAYKTNQSKSS